MITTPRTLTRILHPIPDNGVPARRGSVAAVSRLFGRLRVFRQKQDYMIISKLAIIIGIPKIANLTTLIKDTQLKRRFNRV